MVLTSTSKTVYTYTKNKIDTIYSYSNDFGIWNLNSIKKHEYTGANSVNVKQVNYIGNMITGGSEVLYTYKNNKISNRTGKGGINQSFKYDGDLLIEVCDTPSLMKIEYNNGSISKLLSHSYISKTKEFTLSTEYVFTYSSNKVEIATYYINSKGERKINERKIKYLENDLLVKEEDYFPISNLDSTKYTIIFEYDKKGNQVKRTYYNEEAQTSSSSEYLYDEYENQIELISNSYSGNVSHTYYYYENGSSNMEQFNFPKIKFVDFYVRELNFNNY
jgi:hypothetical protein